MQALVRLRWLVPAISLPVCVLLAALGIQAAALGRPSRDDLVAAQALRTLLAYHVMRATEDIGNHRLHAVCLQGWFRAPRHRHLVRGELVLIGARERLYDYGSGIRRIGEHGPVLRRDRMRFMLAGCPRFLDTEIGDRLIRDLRIDVDPSQADGFRTDSILFGKRRAPIDLFVTSHTHEPVELALARASSDLEPGGSPALVRLVRRAFHLRTRTVRRA